MSVLCSKPSNGFSSHLEIKRKSIPWTPRLYKILPPGTYLTLTPTTLSLAPLLQSFCPCCAWTLLQPTSGMFVLVLCWDHSSPSIHTTRSLIPLKSSLNFSSLLSETFPHHMVVTLAASHTLTHFSALYFSLAFITHFVYTFAYMFCWLSVSSHLNVSKLPEVRDFYFFIF